MRSVQRKVKINFKKGKSQQVCLKERCNFREDNIKMDHMETN
jgi:hypothetical protein